MVPAEIPSLAQLIDPRTREGELWEPLADGRLRCYACGHRCVIPPGQRGVCKVRYNRDGRLLVPWGYVAGLQLDPVEKKPFFHAYPGSKALSFGMLGCDYHCSYCFPGDTPVLTASGTAPIRTIFDAATEPIAIPGGEVRFPQGVKVITASGDARPVLKAFRHSYSGALSVIQPMYLPAIRCTPDHRWLATTDPSGRGVMEVPARELRPHHFVLVPKPSVYVASVGANGQIQGRAVRRQPRQFSVVWRRERGALQRFGETENHFVVPVKSVAVEAFEGDVYNLEVEGEHSYVAGFCAVKNCQNALTSQTLRDPQMGAPPQDIFPSEVVVAARRAGARILTSTYNEPLITSEWAVHIFKAGKAAGLVCSYVSNGNATPEVLDYIRPWVDLYKVDLKGFNDRSYRKLGGLLQNVLDSIRLIWAKGFWLEIVTLVIPGFNDSEEELRDAAQFIASVSPDIPWHVTAFHQDYKMRDRDNTSAKMLVRAAEIGVAAGLRYVYAGNLPGRVGPFEHTYCPTCKTALIERVGYRILKDLLTPTRGACPSCATPIPGRWG